MPPRRLQSPSGRRQFDAGSPTFCVGHRGARAFAPENTLPAFRRAAELGCAAVELDVHLSLDGEVVVHHDDRLARCTDVGSRFPGRDDWISDFTLAELKTLDAGGWYAAQLALPAPQRQAFLQGLTDAEIECHVTAHDRADCAAGHVTIPTLAEVLELARALDLVVNVEIKTLPRMVRGIAERVVAAVAAAGLRDSVLVSSFDHPQLLVVRALDAALPTGVLTSDRLARPADYLRLLDADAYHPGVDSVGFAARSGVLDGSGLDAVRAAGGRVFVWTCNDAAQMAALVAAGVTGVITDYPNRFAAAAALTTAPPAPARPAR